MGDNSISTFDSFSGKALEEFEVELGIERKTAQKL